MNTGYTPVQGRGFVRPENQNLQNFAEIIPVISGLIGGSETNIINARALQMLDEKGVNLTYPPDGNQNMSIISESVFYKLIKTKSAPLPERPCEQLTYCAKNESEQWDYINRVAKRHNCRITGKTKATAKGRQWVLRQIKLERITNNATFAAGGQSVTGKKFRWGYSCSLALRRWSSSRATVTSCPISSAALTPIFSTSASASSVETWGFSPLPSAWRRAISPRTAVTIKFALVSPGCRDASMPLTTSCGNLAFSCCDLLLTELVDMFAPPINNGMQCNTKVNTKKDLKWYSPKCNLNTTRADTCNSAIETTKPRTVGAVTGLLTKPLNEVTIMAGTQHTPRLAHTQTAFVWRFLTLSAGESQIIHVTAWTEREARNRCPSGCVAVFAARIRQEVRHA